VADNRQKLTDIAQSNVQKSGLKGLSFRTLADEVGIKSSSVHYHFPEKADLAQALIEQYSDTFATRLDSISAAGGSLMRKLSRFMDVIEAVAASDSVCLCGMLAAELESLSPENRQALQRFFTDMEDWLTREITAHRADLGTAIEPHQLAKVMVSGVEGALLVSRVQGNTEHLAAQRTVFADLLGPEDRA